MKKIVISIALALPLCLMANDSKLSGFTRAFLDTRQDITAEQRADFRKNFAVKVAENEAEYVSAYVYFGEAVDESVLVNYGAQLNTIFDATLCSADIPADQIEALSNDAAIARVEIGQPVRRRMNKARPAANVDKVHSGTDLSQPFLGTDVIVGVVDYGFQYNHINFYDINNPEELRVKRVWNQSSKKKYTTQSDIEAAQYDDSSDDTGHATHVTGIAAGSYGYGTSSKYYGNAPDADIVMVSYGNSNTDISNGVQYVFNYATEVGKPAVVNLSLGAHDGPHDGTSTFDRAIDAMVGKGRIVVGAAGNEGEYPIYSEATLEAGESHTFVLDPSDSYYSGSQTFASFWGDSNQEYTINIVYLDKSGNELASGTSVNPTNSTKTTTWSNTNYASGKLSVYPEYNETGNNKANAYIYFQNNFKPKSNYKVGFKVTAVTAGTVRVWGDDYYAIYWEGGKTDHTVGEIGGTANGIISVGAFTNYYYYSANNIAGFSSKGPTADGRLKPEICAPGSTIKSSILGTSACTSQAYNKVSETVDGTAYYWADMGGTSMATPFVTGVVATWLQANPNLTPELIKEIFAETSITDTYTGTCPNNTWGYGKIDAHAGLIKALETSAIKNLQSLPDAIMLYPNPSDGAFTLLFTRGDNQVEVSVFAMNGQQIYAQHIGDISQQQTLNINLGAIETGAYIVRIRGNQTNTTCRLLVR